MPTHHVQIWAVNAGEKIHREDLTNPNRHSNRVWNDQVNIERKYLILFSLKAGEAYAQS
ncbi:hypothetical protein GCM10008018_38490 [Paenibacillus marchantiophytorum]|uniref:Uncharacterized protein n=1 Tax=Paenibacillus marchantiophytorum TaxID=1619310 RepID=A0ABQ1EUZ6_9BACL|nr:hypothetical protein [Paenibacillus marchantiophytorum]GFZ88735.1 hypothetical protein GCM10008018_38490 [Paenibacillus marchantiophytorum]